MILSKLKRRVKTYRKLPAQQRRHERRAALEGHMLHRHPRRLAQHLAQEMRQRASGGRAVIGLIRIGFEPCHQLRHRLRRGGWACGKRQRESHSITNWREIFGGVVLDAFEHRRLYHHHGHRHEHERVAIRSGIFHRLRGNPATCAGAVFNNHRASHARRHLLGDQAGGRIG